MQVQIHPSWKAVLDREFQQPYFNALTKFVKEEYGTHRCFPQGKLIFNAFDQCPMETVKVVILGQDPYHGENQAHGLCFSVPKGVPHPPSLINIFKEAKSDLGVPYPDSGDLTSWAKQGVLLLNATLTVRACQAGSHQNKGWERFTDAVIKIISMDRTHVVFMLWGGYAKQKIKLINDEKHCVLTSGHPSPLSANKGYWFGNKHFSKCNDYLDQFEKTKINWNLKSAVNAL